LAGHQTGKIWISAAFAAFYILRFGSCRWFESSLKTCNLLIKVPPAYISIAYIFQPISVFVCISGLPSSAIFLLDNIQENASVATKAQLASAVTTFSSAVLVLLLDTQLEVKFQNCL
jgi:hypothetical protein